MFLKNSLIKMSSNIYREDSKYTSDYSTKASLVTLPGSEYFWSGSKSVDLDQKLDHKNDNSLLTSTYASPALSSRTKLSTLDTLDEIDEENIDKHIRKIAKIYSIPVDSHKTRIINSAKVAPLPVKPHIHKGQLNHSGKFFFNLYF